MIRCTSVSVLEISGQLPCVSCEIIPGQMKKDGCGKTKGIDPIHDPPMTRNDCTVVLHSPIALDRRHDQTSTEPHQSNNQRHDRRLPGGKWSNPPEKSSDKDGTYYSSEKAFDGLVWTYLRRNKMATKSLSENVLQNVGELHNGYKKEEQLAVLSLIPWNFQAQKRRSVADKINAHHEAPLNF